jgi:phosphoserine phosphatase
MNLALFDLDHTLIPFDSGMAWTHFLVERGVLPAQAEET